MLIEIIIAVVIGYLIGSIPWAFLLPKLFGKDIRKVGDKNIGATNVYKNVSKTLGIIVGFLDVLKGFIPMLLVVFLFGPSEINYLFAGVAAIIGHVKPIFLRFKGGKGIATSLGVFVWLVPFLAVICYAILWLALFIITKKTKWRVIFWVLPVLAFILGESLMRIISICSIVILIYMVHYIKIGKIKWPA